MSTRCGYAGCEFLVHSDPSVVVGFCCQKCEGRHHGADWAQGGRRHYKHCEGRCAPSVGLIASPAVSSLPAGFFPMESSMASTARPAPPPPPPKPPSQASPPLKTLQPSHGAYEDDPLAREPWIEMRENCHWCLPCSKWATQDHLGNDKHLWRIKEYYPSSAYPTQRRSPPSAPPVHTVHHVTSPDTANAEPLKTPQPFAAETLKTPQTSPGVHVDDPLAREPWIEMRENCHWCLACNKWATQGHLENDKHLWRIKEYYPSSSYPTQRSSVPPVPPTHTMHHVTPPDTANAEAFLVMKADASGQEYLYCQLCGAFADEKHLESQRHLSRTSNLRYVPSHGAKATAILAKVVKIKKRRTWDLPSLDPDVVVVLEPLEGDTPVDPLNITCFDDWAIPPRVDDVLLVAPKDFVMEDGDILPKLQESAALAPSEVKVIAENMEKRWRSDVVAPVKALNSMITRSYPYIQLAFKLAEAADSASALLRVLHALASSIEPPDAGVQKLLSDAARSPLLSTVAPGLLDQNLLDLQVCEEIAERLMSLCPEAVTDLKPLFRMALTAAEKVQSTPVASTKSEASLPPHWANSSKFPSQGWSLEAIDKDDPVFKALKLSLKTDPAELGIGRDVVDAGSYDRLTLKRAWRIENPNHWKRFELEREILHDRVKACKITMPKLQLKGALKDSSAQLPDELMDDVNECRLFHGTKPDNVLTLLQNGLNERFSKGIFGNGSYLAEDAGKCDQYVTKDRKKQDTGDLEDLHSRLYRKGVKHPGNVFYIFVCRVVLGHFVRTKSGSADAKDLDTSKPVYATSERRELATIPDVSPPMHYHSLLAELGGSIVRYREFVQFHEARIYLEYLLAYQRD